MQHNVNILLKNTFIDTLKCDKKHCVKYPQDMRNVRLHEKAYVAHWVYMPD